MLYLCDPNNSALGYRSAWEMVAYGTEGYQKRQLMYVVYSQYEYQEWIKKMEGL
jgi:hypothetical protein